MFIAFNINHSSILPLMALNSLYCAHVPLSNYSLTHSPVLFGVCVNRSFAGIKHFVADDGTFGFCHHMWWGLQVQTVCCADGWSEHPSKWSWHIYTVGCRQRGSQCCNIKWSQHFPWYGLNIYVCTVSLTVTICGDACPLSCVSAEAYKLAQCTRPQGWGS